jgi:D-arabinose 1-dehydrogenase-like Zn-dependent alcohol dehydrogenase
MERDQRIMTAGSTMRAMLATEAGKPLESVERPLPRPDSGEVLVR